MTTQPKESIPGPSESQPEGSIPEPSQQDHRIEGKAHVYIAPAKVPAVTPGRSVFLAGSIEQGAAEQWQARITEQLKDIECTVFNPRRRHWNRDWEQRKTNPQFREQVEWELDLLEKADVIAMYFDPNTKSPITLLELGLHANDKSKDELDNKNEKKPKLVVCCPEKYHRLGNVEIVCERAGIPVLGTFDELVAEVKQRLKDPKLSPTQQPPETKLS